MTSLRLNSQMDVRAFSVVVTAIAVLADLVLQRVFLPAPVREVAMLPGAITSLIIVAPLSLFIGTRLYDIQRLSSELEYAVSHDALTGMLTRDTFRRKAAQSNPATGALILLDVDRFKQFNDRFGHLSGDHVLRQVARCLKEECRASDLLGRFGGEEFLIFLPGTTLAEGVTAAERLAGALRRASVQIDGQTMCVTASFGVAQLRGPAEMEACLIRADDCLYRAKAAGRDCVVAEPP